MGNYKQLSSDYEKLGRDYDYVWALYKDAFDKYRRTLEEKENLMDVIARDKLGEKMGPRELIEPVAEKIDKPRAKAVKVTQQKYEKEAQMQASIASPKKEVAAEDRQNCQKQQELDELKQQLRIQNRHQNTHISSAVTGRNETTKRRSPPAARPLLLPEKRQGETEQSLADNEEAQVAAAWSPATPSNNGGDAFDQRETSYAAPTAVDPWIGAVEEGGDYPPVGPGSYPGSDG